MKNLFLCTILLLSCLNLNAQYYTFYIDKEHMAIFAANQAMRSLMESQLTNQTGEINQNWEKINANATKLLLAKDIVYRSLTQVNEVLKDGLVAKQIPLLVNDIYSECSRLVNEVSDAPQYALFASQTISNVQTQATLLAAEVSEFITKGGLEALMDNRTRDQLLTNIITRLKILRASISVIRSTIQRAKVYGFWRSLNPFQAWINQDIYIVNNIIRDYNRLLQ
ncbi:MAG TPA: hypothetical protein VKZ57_02810 [Sphingobacterium sp.]|nr:hypothetical protein [Sphingobacterium sp.]